MGRVFGGAHMYADAYRPRIPFSLAGVAGSRGCSPSAAVGYEMVVVGAVLRSVAVSDGVGIQVREVVIGDTPGRDRLAVVQRAFPEPVPRISRESSNPAESVPCLAP